MRIICKQVMVIDIYIVGYSTYVGKQKLNTESLYIIRCYLLKTILAYDQFFFWGGRGTVSTCARTDMDICLWCHGNYILIFRMFTKY